MRPTTTVRTTTTTVAGATPPATTPTGPTAPPPTNTVAPDDVDLDIDVAECDITITAAAENAGTAVVRMVGPGIDRSYLMAITDGVAEIQIPVEGRAVGEYRFDVTVTGVSTSVVTSSSQDLDCEG